MTFKDWFGAPVLDDFQNQINEGVVNNIHQLTKAIATMAGTIQELTTAVRLLHERVVEIEKYVIHLHHRLKALEPIDVNSNGFPKFKI